LILKTKLVFIDKLNEKRYNFNKHIGIVGIILRWRKVVYKYILQRKGGTAELTLSLIKEMKFFITIFYGEVKNGR